MAALTFHPNKRRQQSGFTLIEVMGAIFVLAFGLLAIAGSMSQMSSGTSQSRYLELAAMLASEKLDDLSRVPNAYVGMQNNGGSLTSPTSTTFSTASGNVMVSYNDTVQISADKGGANEVISGTNAAGVVGYWTINTGAGGTATSYWSSGSPPAATSDMLVFNRFWTVEMNQPISGVRRLTVVVTLTSPAQQGKPVSFQATMVHP